MTIRLCFSAISRISFMFAGWPKRWTGMIALVLGVIAFSNALGDIVQVSLSISANLGTAPVYEMEAHVAMKVFGTVMTSSPLPIPFASSARWRADVPVFTPTENFALQ